MCLMCVEQQGLQNERAQWNQKTRHLFRRYLSVCHFFHGAVHCRCRHFQENKLNCSFISVVIILSPLLLSWRRQSRRQVLSKEKSELVRIQKHVRPKQFVCRTSIETDLAGLVCNLSITCRRQVMPNTHRRRRRDETVESRRVGGVNTLVGSRDPVYNVLC